MNVNDTVAEIVSWVKIVVTLSVAAIVLVVLLLFMAALAGTIVGAAAGSIVGAFCIMSEVCHGS